MERMRNFDRETSGRVAMAEIAAYDGIIAEILNDRMAGKCRARKHRENRERRSPGNARTRKALKSWARSIPAYGKEISMAEFRAESRAEIIIADFESEPDVTALIAEACKCFRNAENDAWNLNDFVPTDDWWSDDLQESGYELSMSRNMLICEYLLDQACITMSEFTDWYYAQ